MKKLEASDLIALSLDEINKRGTPEHKKAARLLRDAVRTWKRQLWERCPKCGRRKYRLKYL